MRALSFSTRSTLALISILGSGVAAPALLAQSYVAPTNETVTTRTEEGLGSSISQVIWIHNGSTVPIDVYSVTLRDCDNVKQDCSPRPLRMHLQPGRSDVLTRVEPRDAERGYSYRYTFGWRADSAYMAALHVLAATGTPQAEQRLASQEKANDDERTTVGSHDIVLGRDELATLGPKVYRLAVEPDSIVLHVGQSFLMHEVRVLAYDLQGNLLGRVASFQGRMLQGVMTVHGDTATAERAGRSRMEFRLAPPAAPLTAVLPIVVEKADTTR